jgi:hypothetical protein
MLRGFHSPTARVWWLPSDDARARRGVQVTPKSNLPLESAVQFDRIEV